jgi:hypothetical protein
MTIRFQVSHIERTVIGIGEGTVTVQDIARFAFDVAENRAIDYWRILDLMGCKTVLSEADVVAYRDIIRQLPVDRRPSGLTALVASEQNAALSRLFTDTIGTDRPAKVFASIHDARSWFIQTSAARRQHPSHSKLLRKV